MKPVPGDIGARGWVKDDKSETGLSEATMHTHIHTNADSVILRFFFCYVQIEKVHTTVNQVFPTTFSPYF